jgi:hypothetical protein
MSIDPALSIPVRTRPVGEAYLKTFDAKFHLTPPAPVRTTPFIDDSPMADYKAGVFSRFEATKGLFIDTHA